MIVSGSSTDMLHLIPELSNILLVLSSRVLRALPLYHSVSAEESSSEESSEELYSEVLSSADEIGSRSTGPDTCGLPQAARLRANVSDSAIAKIFFFINILLS